MEYWIIDGYNVLHGLKPLGRKQLPLTRENLFAQLATFASFGERKVLVILDGIGNDEEWNSFKTAQFSVQYSQKFTADTVIERYLAENRTKRLYVITGDVAISRVARGYGASVFSVKEFESQLKEAKKATSDILFKQKVDSRTFNRPFDDKFKKFD